MRVTVPPLADRRRESRFFSAMAMAMAIVVFVGFSRTYYLSGWFPQTAARAAPENYFNLHGAVFTAWMMLLVLQTTFVRTGYMNLHRSIGIGGMFLAILLVLSGIYAALLAASRPDGFIGVPVPPGMFLVVPLADVLLFGVFAAIAYSERRGKKSHKRWIMLATVNLLGAAFARILPAAWLTDISFLLIYVFVNLFIVALAMWDLKTLGRLHPVTLWGGLVVIASQPLRMVLADTAAWQAFADWAIGLIARS
ncbi:MAG: hypothetical protein WBM68_06170 [Woeseia sp.]